MCKFPNKRARSAGGKEKLPDLISQRNHPQYFSDAMVYFLPPQILSTVSWEESDASRRDRGPSLCGTFDRCRLALEVGEWPPSRLGSHR